MNKIIIVRHGETDWNVAGVYQGATDVPLNEKGKAQARELAERIDLAGVEVCVASPLSRARETAEIVVNGRVPIFADADLAERSYGDLEGTKVSSDAYFRYWRLGQEDDGHKVEKLEDFMVRVGRFLERIKREYPEKTILVVSHGGFIKALHYYLAGYDDATDFTTFHVGNTEVVEFEF